MAAGGKGVGGRAAPAKHLSPFSFSPNPSLSFLFPFFLERGRSHWKRRGRADEVGLSNLPWGN